jgi:hypothetical protein
MQRRTANKGKKGIIKKKIKVRKEEGGTVSTERK